MDGPGRHPWMQKAGADVVMDPRRWRCHDAASGVATVPRRGERCGAVRRAPLGNLRVEALLLVLEHDRVDDLGDARVLEAEELVGQRGGVEGGG